MYEEGEFDSTKVTGHELSRICLFLGLKTLDDLLPGFK